jgi:hypothetical protein
MTPAQGPYIFTCLQLRSWGKGVPVDCWAPWLWGTIEAVIEKGAHKLAVTDESIALRMWPTSR